MPNNRSRHQQRQNRRNSHRSQQQKLVGCTIAETTSHSNNEEVARSFPANSTQFSLRTLIYDESLGHLRIPRTITHDGLRYVLSNTQSDDSCGFSGEVLIRICNNIVFKCLPLPLKVAVIDHGCSIGHAIVTGLSSCVLRQLFTIFTSSPILEPLKSLPASDVNKKTDCLQIARKCSVIILCAKPENAEKFLLSFAKTDEDELKEKVLVSVVDGLSIKRIQELCPRLSVFRIMPNIFASSCNSSTALVGDLCDVFINKSAAVVTIANEIGNVQELEEESLPNFAAVSSCLSLLTFSLVEVMMNILDSNDISRSIGVKLIASSFTGASSLLYNEQLEKKKLTRSKFESPGGTAIAGIVEMKRRGLDNMVESTIEKMIEDGKKVENLSQ